MGIGGRKGEREEGERTSARAGKGKINEGVQPIYLGRPRESPRVIKAGLRLRRRAYYPDRMRPSCREELHFLRVIYHSEFQLVMAIIQEPRPTKVVISVIIMTPPTSSLLISNGLEAGAELAFKESCPRVVGLEACT